MKKTVQNSEKGRQRSPEPASMSKRAASHPPSQTGPLAQLRAWADQSSRVRGLMGLAQEINQSPVAQRRALLSQDDALVAPETTHANAPAQLRIDIHGTLAHGDRSREVESVAGENNGQSAQQSSCGCGEDKDSSAGSSKELTGRKTPAQKKEAHGSGVRFSRNNRNGGAQAGFDQAVAAPRASGAGRAASAESTADAVVQCFPYEKKNDKTGRTFKITNDGSQLTAVQTEGDPNDPHFGYATYKILKDSLELGHIESDPEEGSGIGSLLMHYLAEIALKKGLKTMTIPTAAPTAIGFYELMGFESANPEYASSFEKKISEMPEQVETAENLYFVTRARIAYNTDPENRRLRKKGVFSSEKVRREWGDLPRKEQDRLALEQKKKFYQLPGGEQRKIRAMMLHGKAVGMTGMVARADAVLKKAAPFLARWVDAGEWAKVWESRKDTKHLTFFPRHPDEE